MAAISIADLMGMPILSSCATRITCVVGQHTAGKQPRCVSVYSDIGMRCWLRRTITVQFTSRMKQRKLRQSAVTEKVKIENLKTLQEVPPKPSKTLRYFSP
jgi:hypothetical protein